MSSKSKKSFAEKMQKSPFMTVGAIAAAVLALVVILSVTSGIKKGIAEKNAETTAPNKRVEASSTEAKLFNSKAAENGNIKLYDKSVKSASAAATRSVFKISVSFTNGTPDIKSAFIAVFVDGNTVIKLPCNVSTDKMSAEFSLDDISDAKNVLSLTDGINLTFETFAQAKPYAVFASGSESDFGDTVALCGTQKNTGDFSLVENGASFSSASSGIKRVEASKNDKFLWLDIYFADEESFKGLNFGFKNNFVGFNYGGSSTLFSVTEYENLKMLRCKFDSYALEQLKNETGDSDLTISEVFKNVEIFSSDYDETTRLFVLA